MSDQPIGVFDSGVGGLAVVAEIEKLLPQEDIIYYADTAHFPYGPRPTSQVVELSVAAADFLLNRGAKLVVVACNTASSAALATLRQRFAIPFVGMVPAIKPASALTRRGRVGVMATEATVEAQVFSELIAQFAEGVEVFTKTCPQLVELVEAGDTDSPYLHRLLHHYLDPLIGEGIDVLVLGCSHFPFLRPAIQRVVGDGVVVIDPAPAVARQVERVLEAHNLASVRGRGKATCFTSGPRARFIEVTKRLLPDMALWWGKR